MACDDDDDDDDREMVLGFAQTLAYQFRSLLPRQQKEVPFGLILDLHLLIVCLRACFNVFTQLTVGTAASVIQCLERTKRVNAG